MNTQAAKTGKISDKQYQCPVCKNISTHATNHFGDIWSGCKKCGDDILNCIEPEALNAKLNVSVIETKLHKYHYDISDPTQKKGYLTLCAQLKNKGFKLFNSIDFHKHGYYDMLAETIFIETDYVFDNQWNSSAGRVFDWKESIYPNKKIKQGYWLELTEEHIKAREPKEYACETYYKGELLGKDIIHAINSGEASNQLYHKYYNNTMDIFSYANEIILQQK